MNGRKVKQERRKAEAARLKLCMELAEYWFRRQYPAWWAAVKDTGKPTLTEDEALAIIKERFLRIDAMDDGRLEQLRVATVRDITRQTSPLRRAIPKNDNPLLNRMPNPQLDVVYSKSGKE